MRRLVYIFIIALLVCLTIAVLGYRYQESRSKIASIWRLEAIIIEQEDVTTRFRRKSISFMDNNEVSLPKKWTFKMTTPIKYSRWEYKRRDFINGQVIIDDKNQLLFSGVYEIEILDHSTPQLIKLSSDRIDLYLRGILGFTDGQTTIPIDWLEGTERDPRHPKNREVKSDSTSMEDSE